MRKQLPDVLDLGEDAYRSSACSSVEVCTKIEEPPRIYGAFVITFVTHINCDSKNLKKNVPSLRPVLGSLRTGYQYVFCLCTFE